jgi:hypothetical protein
LYHAGCFYWELYANQYCYLYAGAAGFTEYSYNYWQYNYYQSGVIVGRDLLAIATEALATVHQQNSERVMSTTRLFIDEHGYNMALSRKHQTPHVEPCLSVCASQV